MAWQIVIDFDPPTDDGTFLHNLRNYGEALWHASKEDGWASMDLDEIDRATHKLTMTVSSSRHLRRKLALTRKILDEYFPAGCARISTNNTAT